MAAADSVSRRASDDGRPTPTGRSSGVPVDTGLPIPAAAVEALARATFEAEELRIAQERGREPDHEWAALTEQERNEARADFAVGLQAALEVMGARVEGSNQPAREPMVVIRCERLVTAWTPIEEGEND